MSTATPGPDPVHLMTIEMGCWCGASGPGNGRASSAWREVTCASCLAMRTEGFRVLVWDMLQAMPASREALAFAVRAGRLGVTNEQGRTLAMACAPGNGSALADDEAERADVLRMRREMAREAGDDPPGADPDDGRHPDGCTCQFCREDEREERDREELDDDIDNTIPDTERGDL